MRNIAIGTGVLGIHRGDIARLGRHVGAIVNAANAEMRPSPGVCGTIFEVAGPDLIAECLWVGKVETGRAVATTAGQLDADCVIHAVGPVWQGGAKDEDRLLASAYRTSLDIAAQKGLRSIAFPSIGTGSYGYPLDRAAAIAIGTAAAYLKRGGVIEEVILVTSSDFEYQAYEIAADRWEQLQSQRAVETQGRR